MSKAHLDPYARAVNTPFEWGAPRETTRGVQIEEQGFDWEGVKSPSRPLDELIIYEMHVRAFTKHPSSGVKHPGTFLGVIEKIPHLVDLGINCVELMPIFEFDETKHPTLCNLWGYNTEQFFCPMKRYSVKNPILECKQMIKALHKARIEVILDVVYNHSSSFEFDRENYYILENGKHTNYSGCGNTINANAPKAQKLILDSLKMWSEEFHIDGFRFDLAAALTRGADGNRMEPAPIVEAITKQFSHKKLIAEPWDPGGLYMLGEFPKGWGEWNGKFRDGVRKKVNFSKDYHFEWSGASKPINYITSHDGMTLFDLVSYDEKQNMANNENNEDGDDQNFSRSGNDKQERMEAMVKELFQADGTPMILMGDEFLHTRRGNNNTWCQDNDLNWINWNKKTNWYDFIRSHILRRKQEFK